MNKKTAIWDAVCTTNPDMTKRVDRRGGFTAIDAYSQIHAATKYFGAVGQGWGWDDLEFIFPPNDTVIAKAYLWHGTRENRFPIVGQKKLNDKHGNPDEDALKKALTDAVTKGLSYLGFNADVFTGKFDDNKYVESMRQKYAEIEWRGPLKVTALKERMRELDKDLKATEDADTLAGVLQAYTAPLEQCQHDLPEWWEGANGAIEKLQAQFEKEAA